jgi:hypothetical protein
LHVVDSPRVQAGCLGHAGDKLADPDQAFKPAREGSCLSHSLIRYIVHRKKTDRQINKSADRQINWQIGNSTVSAVADLPIR